MCYNTSPMCYLFNTSGGRTGAGRRGSQRGPPGGTPEARICRQYTHDGLVHAVLSYRLCSCIRNAQPRLLQRPLVRWGTHVYLQAPRVPNLNLAVPAASAVWRYPHAFAKPPACCIFPGKIPIPILFPFPSSGPIPNLGTSDLSCVGVCHACPSPYRILVWQC
jgi:hypothetical protein